MVRSYAVITTAFRPVQSRPLRRLSIERNIPNHMQDKLPDHDDPCDELPTLIRIENNNVALFAATPNEFQIRPIQNRIVHSIHRLRRAFEFAAEAAFEAIDSPQSIVT
ncbi:MAG: hypothetical protein CNIPEHKO_01756 [Anaerolineales bacterium]|nr:hypothetical protein [Anaerolineales bacterium]